MKPRSLSRCALPLGLFFLGGIIASAEEIRNIHPTGYVTDLAGVIGAEKSASLEALCTELEQKTGTQMAIVTVRSLEGESVDRYAVDLFKQLGIGRKSDNRGLLLLLAPTERKYRIEVGYGLEPVINDARAGDAGRAMVPFLRQSDYGGAVETGARQLAQYIADERGIRLSVPHPREERPSAQSDGESSSIFVVVAFAIIFIIILGGGTRLLAFLLGMSLGGSGGRSGSNWGSGGSWGGGGFGGGGGGFGGFGGGSSGGGGASGSW